MGDEPMGAVQARSLREALSSVPDPRSRCGRRYDIGAVLSLAVCAMLCGAKSLYAIAQWGRDHGDWVAGALGMARGTTPCVATLHLLFKRLDEAALESVLSSWFLEQGLRPGEAAAIDGKSLRGLHGDAVPGVHLVALYAQQTGCVLAQKGGGGQVGGAVCCP